MRAEDAEMALMREQLAKGASIYGCDDWAVYSDTKTWLSPGPPVRLETTVVAADLTKSAHGNSTKKEPNGLQFLKVWDKIREDSRYKDSNWAVKVDPDTVFFPERLKASLKRERRAPSDPALFANCRAEGHPHFMFGAIEVFSKATLEAFFQDGDRCKEELEADQMWEERYMSHCLRLLKVPMVTDFNLLQDGHCDFGEPTVPCTADAVAFHPLKTPAEYNACWDQAEAHWKEVQKKTEEAGKDKEQPAKSEKKHSGKDVEHGEAQGGKRQKSQIAEEETAAEKAETSSKSRAEGKETEDAKSRPEHLAKAKGAEAKHKGPAKSGHEEDTSEPAKPSEDFKEEGDFVPIEG